LSKPKLTILIVVPVALVAIGAIVLQSTFLKQNLPAAERGRRIAEREGCFTCHGPGGIHGTANPGRPFPEVPNFEGDLMMYAKNAEEIREWIRDGVPKRKAESKSWQKERDAGVLVMPAFADRLSRSQIEDIVAYVMALAHMPSPSDSLARRGFDRAQALGCFGCHGPGGRLAKSNPGSLKGYIPSWDGRDFSELVQSRDEFDQWVEHGISDRFKKSSLARMFLERANVRMPAFDQHLEPGDDDAIWAYIHWMRSEPPPPGR
jgi:mono/diheme cytochrome c family protein